MVKVAPLASASATYAETEAARPSATARRAAATWSSGSVTAIFRRVTPLIIPLRESPGLVKNAGSAALRGPRGQDVVLEG